MTISGGLGAFPGPHTFTIDSNELPISTAEELKRLLQAAHFFQRSNQAPAPRHVYDGFTYTITVESDSQHHTIRTFDPLPDQDIAKLVMYIQQHGKAL